MGRLSRRVARPAARLDPAPDPRFLAFARAVIAWGGAEPTEAGARELARALQGTGRGATWTALMTLAEEGDDALDIPVVDPAWLTPAEREEAGRLESLIGEGGLASLSNADLTVAECPRRKLDGEDVGACRGLVATAVAPLTDGRIWPREGWRPGTCSQQRP